MSSEPTDAPRRARSWLGLTPASRRRLRIMYHVMFVLLLGHFVLVYLKPGYFHDPRGGFDARRALTGAERPQASRVIERDGRRWLPGGDDPDEHFDVTNFRLDPDRLNYGIGREAFPALIEPRFVPAKQADAWLDPGDRVLAVRLGGEHRVYPVELLIHHEVVNDEVAGVPIFAAYCILADLGAVYDRRIAGHRLTFALSGYTYADPQVWDGLDAFVLWDRETESLWWPPIGRAVSGPLIDTPLPLLDESAWTQTTWAQARAQDPTPVVLEKGQDFERPSDWPRIEIADAQTPAPDDASASAPAPPRWGQQTPW